MNSNDFKKTAQLLCQKIVELEKTECIVCFKKIKIGTLLIPCNHYQYCFNCSTHLDNCPLCRTEIEHIVNYGECSDMKSVPELIDAIGDTVNQNL